MKDRVIATEKQNNFVIINKGVNISLTLDKTLVESVSLKKLLKAKLSGAVYLENLKIQIIIAQDIHVDLIDDLLDFDITRSKLEFILNEGSTLNYELKMVESNNSEKTDDGLLLSYNQQGYVEKELDFKFIGKHSAAKVRCACKGEYDRLFRFKTIQDHQAADTKSDLVIKGVFSQKSKFICDSLIKVSKDAQMVEATQLNKNLLLGDDSRAVCLPKLEVKADDVKCKHGAAVSKLDEEQLFYLQSRGMDYCSAKNLLIDAFLN